MCRSLGVYMFAARMLYNAMSGLADCDKCSPSFTVASASRFRPGAVC